MEMNRESFFREQFIRVPCFSETKPQPVKKNMFLGQIMIPKEPFRVTSAEVAIIFSQMFSSIDIARREPTWSLTSKVMWLSSPGPSHVQSGHVTEVFVPLHAEADGSQNMKNASKITFTPPRSTNIAGWKIPILNRKYVFRWWIFQPAMSDYRSVNCLTLPKLVKNLEVSKITVLLCKFFSSKPKQNFRGKVLEIVNHDKSSAMNICFSSCDGFNIHGDKNYL